MFCLGSDALKPDDVTDNDAGKVMDIPKKAEGRIKKRQAFLATITAGVAALKKAYAVGTPFLKLRSQADQYVRDHEPGWYGDCHECKVLTPTW